MPPFQLPGESTKTIAIVGGGFAGTATQLHWLLKIADDPAITEANPIRMTLIERYPQQKHGGIAYGKTPAYDHNLNLTSKRVTPFMRGKPPEGFPTFDEYIEQRAQENPAFAKNFANPERKVYGDYLSHLIDLAMVKVGGKVKMDTTFAELVDFEDRPNGVTLHLNGGTTMEACHLILATGLKDTVRPSFTFNIAASPNYLEYPYSAAANEFFDKLMKSPRNTEQDSALVIGTGLSGMDSAIRLLDGGYKGKITMVSRHGFMHPVYRDEGIPLKGRLKGEPRPLSELAFAQQEPLFMKKLHCCNSFDSLFNRMTVELNQLMKQGYTSEEVTGYWEKFVPQLYAKFPEGVADYLSSNETGINILRVGTTPELADKIRDAHARGQLDFVAANVMDTAVKGGTFEVTLRPNDSHGKQISPLEKRNFTTVVNGIGNNTNYDLPADQITDTLWRNLRIKDGYKSHLLHDGVDVTNEFTMRRGDGTPYNNVSIVGTPVSGHISLVPYPYPEKEGEGGRLGAFSINIQGTLGSVLAMIDSKFDGVNQHQRDVSNAPVTGYRPPLRVPQQAF